jgi:transposase-like protein
LTYSKAFREAAVAQTLGPLSIGDVAEIFEVSLGCLWRWKRDAGFTRPMRQPPLCHPELPHYGLKMCRSCYYKSVRKRVKDERTREAA